VHGRTIRLLRAGHGSIDVWVPRFYHGAGDGKRTRLERLLDLDLGHDDQVFRLRESPAAACELP